MTSTLDSISPWSFIITLQKYEYYFNFSLFRQLFIDFPSLFLQNNKNAPEKNYYFRHHHIILPPSSFFHITSSIYPLSAFRLHSPSSFLHHKSHQPSAITHLTSHDTKKSQPVGRLSPILFIQILSSYF